MSLFKRVRLPGLLVGALALALVGCGGGGGGSGGPDASDAEDDFVVVQEIPTNGQQVSGKLEGVANNQISIEFSTPLDESTILDHTNPFNGLSANLTMLDNTLYRVPGTPEVRGKYFRFIPPSTGLPNQQYTLSVTPNVTSEGGQALMHDFYTSFTVRGRRVRPDHPSGISRPESEQRRAGHGDPVHVQRVARPGQRQHADRPRPGRWREPGRGHQRDDHPREQRLRDRLHSRSVDRPTAEHDRCRDPDRWRLRHR